MTEAYLEHFLVLLLAIPPGGKDFSHGDMTHCDVVFGLEFFLYFS